MIEFEIEMFKTVCFHNDIDVRECDVKTMHRVIFAQMMKWDAGR